MVHSDSKTVHKRPLRPPHCLTVSHKAHLPAVLACKIYIITRAQTFRAMIIGLTICRN